MFLTRFQQNGAKSLNHCALESRLHIYALRFWCLFLRKIAVLPVVTLENCENLFSVNKYAQQVAPGCAAFINCENRIESVTIVISLSGQEHELQIRIT